MPQIHITHQFDAVSQRIGREHGHWTLDQVRPEVDHVVLVVFADGLQFPSNLQVFALEISTEPLPRNDEVRRRGWELLRIFLVAELGECLLLLECHHLFVLDARAACWSRKRTCSFTVLNIVLVIIILDKSINTIECSRVQKSHRVVLWDKANDVASRVKNRESVMSRLASLHHSLDSFNILKGDDNLAHNLRSNNSLTRRWDTVLEHWHLFASGGALVQRPRAEVANLICNGDCDDHRREYGNILRCFHEDNGERIRHPRVAGHESAACQDDVASREGRQLFFWKRTQWVWTKSHFIVGPFGETE